MSLCSLIIRPVIIVYLISWIGYNCSEPISIDHEQSFDVVQSVPNSVIQKLFIGRILGPAAGQAIVVDVHMMT